MTYRHLIILSLLLALGFSSCQRNTPKAQRTITVSIEPLRYFTEQIAGDKFKVNTLVPRGDSPETYEPTARQMMDISHSDLYIKAGQLGFERTWMKKLEQNAPHTIIINASEHITPLQCLYGSNDPHTWMSTGNAIIMARNIYKALALIDNKDSLYFKSNLEKFTEQVRKLDYKMREQLTRDASKAFLIYHPTLTYLAADYGLLQIPIQEDGKEPSASQLVNVINMAKKQQVSILFIQQQVNSRSVDAVATETGVQKVIINPLNYHWDEEMMHITESLK